MATEVCVRVGREAFAGTTSAAKVEGGMRMRNSSQGIRRFSTGSTLGWPFQFRANNDEKLFEMVYFLFLRSLNSG